MSSGSRRIEEGRCDQSFFLEVRKTSDKGLGVYALKAFHPGELILSIIGTLVEEQTEHSIQVDWNRHLVVTNPACFINHSCEPNLGLRTNKNGLPDLYVRRQIFSGDELTFDYGMSEYTHYNRKDPTQEFDLTCGCNSKKCRGKLGYFSELPDTVKQQYLDEGYIASYLMTPCKTQVIL